MLGIFQHKKEKYNKLILKCLAFGPKTTTQIAEYVYLNRKKYAVPSPKLDKNEVKKLGSQISRKGYRLEELESKHYIFRRDSLWYQTMKGTCVSLTLFDNLEEIRPHIRTDLTVPAFEQPAWDLAREIEKSPFLKVIMETQGLREKMRSVLEFGKSPSYLLWFRDYTNELINQGVDLDTMSEEEFRTLFISRGIQRFFDQEISNLSKYLAESIQEKRKGELSHE